MILIKPHLLSFDGKKQGQSHLFFWYSPLFGMHQKQPEISEIALCSFSIKLKPDYFSVNPKVFFQQRACNYLSHSTTNHFISFLSNTKYFYIFCAVLSSGNISSQSPTGLYNLQEITLLIYVWG